MRLIHCVVALLAVLPLPVLASAQTVTVDLNKAKLAWDWTKGTPPNDGDPEGFTAKCGRVTGVYSSTTPINDGAARSANIRSIVNGTGIWFCAIGAQNRYGPSPTNSNEVTFDAGAVPAGPTNNRVQAQ
jgi:hypothetical protein